MSVYRATCHNYDEFILIEVRRFNFKRLTRVSFYEMRHLREITGIAVSAAY